MSYQGAVWRSRTVALALLLFTGRGLGHAGPTEQPSTSTPWPFQLEWEYAGPGGTYFQLCVDNACTPLAVTPYGGSTWRAPLPALPLGEHHLVVKACIGSQCVPGTPDIFVRVVPPSARRPPIEIIDGPRIPVGGR